MTDIRKEALSAFIDGEASEIEVHRLVREYDKSLGPSWAIYQHVRTVVKNESTYTQPSTHLELFQRISASIQSEQNHDQGPVRRVYLTASRRGWAVGSLALAASLVVGVYIGSSGLGSLVPQTDVTSVGNQELATNVQPDVTSPPVTAQLAVADDTQLSELIELDEEKQKLLRTYLNQHERMTRMEDNTSLVNYKSGNR